MNFAVISRKGVLSELRQGEGQACWTKAMNFVPRHPPVSMRKPSEKQIVAR